VLRGVRCRIDFRPKKRYSTKRPHGCFVFAESSSGGNEKQPALLLIRFREAWNALLFVFKAARSSNGRTRPSGGRYLGSSPSLAALKRNERKGPPSGGRYLGSSPGSAAKNNAVIFCCGKHVNCFTCVLGSNSTALIGQQTNSRAGAQAEASV